MHACSCKYRGSIENEVAECRFIDTLTCVTKTCTRILGQAFHRFFAQIACELAELQTKRLTIMCEAHNRVVFAPRPGQVQYCCWCWCCCWCSFFFLLSHFKTRNTRAFHPSDFKQVRHLQQSSIGNNLRPLTYPEKKNEYRLPSCSRTRPREMEKPWRG